MKKTRITEEEFLKLCRKADEKDVAICRLASYFYINSTLTVITDGKLVRTLFGEETLEEILDFFIRNFVELKK